MKDIVMFNKKSLFLKKILLFTLSGGLILSSCKAKTEETSLKNMIGLSLVAGGAITGLISAGYTGIEYVQLSALTTNVIGKSFTLDSHGNWMTSTITKPKPQEEIDQHKDEIAKLGSHALEGIAVCIGSVIVMCAGMATIMLHSDQEK
jgi:hypothetical protein